MQNKSQILKKASWISIIGNAFLSILKIIIGIFSGSLAVVADGIDSASDIVTSMITLLTAKIIAKPPDIRFSYGYNKADTIASKVLAFIIFFAGAQLAISTFTKLIENEVREMPTFLAIYVTIVSIVGKWILAFYQSKVGKKANSLMLIANAKNMYNDVIISFSVLLGLTFTFIFKMPVLDIITAFLVSGWIMFVAFKIFLQTNIELMDGVEDISVYKKVFEAVEKTEGAHNPHHVRIRQINNNYLIALDIEIKETVSVKKAHEIAHETDKNIRSAIGNVYDILIHTEPEGVHHSDEVYGVSIKDIR